MSYKAGFVGLIGQPNAGKSTLMNFLVKEKVAIVSAKPQTTRRRSLGILSTKNGQIVFVDAPGLVQAHKGLNGFLAQEAEDVIASSDVLWAIVSVDEVQAEDANKVIELVSKQGKPWIGIITKVDLKEKNHRVMILKDMIESKGAKCFSLSVKTDDSSLSEDGQLLIEEVMALLPESKAPLYDAELFTPDTIRYLSAEIVREKCFEFLHQEIPYSLAVRVMKFDEEGHKIPHLSFEIIVAKENHKSIVIGQKGQMIKQIGMEARKEIEKLMDEKIFLELHVTYKENWFEQKNTMKELGYVVDDRKK